MNFEENSHLDFTFSVSLFEFSIKYILSFKNEINQEIDVNNNKISENEYKNIIVKLINFLGSLAYH